jgi:hypothetical protein
MMLPEVAISIVRSSHQPLDVVAVYTKVMCGEAQEWPPKTLHRLSIWSSPSPFQSCIGDRENTRRAAKTRSHWDAHKNVRSRLCVVLDLQKWIRDNLVARPNCVRKTRHTELPQERPWSQFHPPIHLSSRQERSEKRRVLCRKSS